MDKNVQMRTWTLTGITWAFGALKRSYGVLEHASRKSFFFFFFLLLFLYHQIKTKINILM